LQILVDMSDTVWGSRFWTKLCIYRIA